MEARFSAGVMWKIASHFFFPQWDDDAVQAASRFSDDINCCI